MTDKTTETTVGLSVGLIICVMLVAMIPVISLKDSASTKFYADVTATTIGGTKYMSLNKTAPSTGYNFTVASAAAGEVSLGNSTVLVGTGFDSQVRGFPIDTWTFTVYGLSNVTLKTKVMVNASVLYTNGTVKYNIGKIYSDLLTNANSSKTGTYSITSKYNLDETDYFALQWYLDKTDATALTTDVYFAVTGSLTSLELMYDYDAITGTVRVMVYTATAFVMLAIALTALFIVLKKRRD